MARDCTQRRGGPGLGGPPGFGSPAPAGAPIAQQFDSEYAKLMAELGETDTAPPIAATGPPGPGGSVAAPGMQQSQPVDASGNKIPPWRIPENWCVGPHPLHECAAADTFLRDKRLPPMGMNRGPPPRQPPPPPAPYGGPPQGGGYNGYPQGGYPGGGCASNRARVVGASLTNLPLSQTADIRLNNRAVTAAEDTDDRMMDVDAAVL